MVHSGAEYTLNSARKMNIIDNEEDNVNYKEELRTPSPRPPRPPPGRSPLSSDGVLSSGVSPASSLGGSPHQRSPTARLAFAL